MSVKVTYMGNDKICSYEWVFTKLEQTKWYKRYAEKPIILTRRTMIILIMTKLVGDIDSIELPLCTHIEDCTLVTYKTASKFTLTFLNLNARNQIATDTRERLIANCKN